jgi:hypothetical protein
VLAIGMLAIGVFGREYRSSQSIVYCCDAFGSGGSDLLGGGSNEPLDISARSLGEDGLLVDRDSSSIK